MVQNGDQNDENLQGTSYRSSIPTQRVWSILSPDGTHIDGNSHPTATTHGDLSSLHKNPNHVVEYSVESGGKYLPDRLSIRTFSKKSLQTAIDHFGKIPKPSGRDYVVSHDHYKQHWTKKDTDEGIKSFDGRPHQTLGNMKKLAGIKEHQGHE